LIVDDSWDNRVIYAEFLTFRGYRVAEAVDGLEALDKVLALQPDLVVLDLSMPGMDGRETTRRLKADPLTRAIPILVLTGRLHLKDAALAAGADAYVAKPCLPDELIAEIEELLQRPDGRVRADARPA
jgi:CheY-like chemotaxis protein